METGRFCVYNQSSECFLSLGVTAAETMTAQFKSLARRRAFSYDEGLWVSPSSGLHTFSLGNPAPLDLVYLDRNFRVIHLVESLRKFRIAPLRMDAASVLALPEHTVYSSQTLPGNQLVICVAEEMEFQLAGIPGLARPAAMTGFDAAPNGADLAFGQLLHERRVNRRRTQRQMWPRLIAHDWDGAELVVHGIRDASATGLYLLTEKRWPLGALVSMTLQRTDNVDEYSETSITVQMKVMHWGLDGVGLAFFSPQTLESSEWVERDPVRNERKAIAVRHGRTGIAH
jgi:uncharacterized membrane protein (UPF0127 family)